MSRGFTSMLLTLRPFKTLGAQLKVVFVWMMLCGVADANERLLSRAVEVEIPSQALEAALLEFGRQTDTQVLMDSRVVRGAVSVAVSGKYSLGDAINLLLSATQLQASVSGENTLTILPANASRTETTVDFDELFAANDPAVEGAITEAAPRPDEPVSIVLLEEPVETIEPKREQPQRAIEEIIVTATKRERSVRELASSVSALLGSALEDAGIQEVDGIVDAIAGVNLVDEVAGAQPKRITIRGISAGNGQVDTAGLFLDETPFSDPFQPIATLDPNPFDMATVEVLKGPIGTLFGGSALNGGIRYIPVQPALDQWEIKAFAETSQSRFSESLSSQYGLAVNVPLFDNLAVRATGLLNRRAGKVDDLHPQHTRQDSDSGRQHGGRAILRFLPMDELDLSLMYSEQYTAKLDDAHSSPDLPAFQRDDTPRASTSFARYKSWQLKGDWNLGWANLVAVASLTDKSIDIDDDGSDTTLDSPPTSLLQSQFVGTGETTTQEIRLVSATNDSWDYLLGVFNFRYAVLGDLKGIVPFGAPVTDITTLLNLGDQQNLASNDGLILLGGLRDAVVTEQAFFGELNWRFSPAFEVTAGLRGYRFSYDALQRFIGPLSAPIDPEQYAANGGVVELDLQETESGLSPKLSLKWEPAESLMSYVSVSRGFRFGGVNGLAHPEIPPVYGSDSLWNYEVGLRSQWLDDSLIADLTIFHIDWQDAQFQKTTSDGQFGGIDNVASVVGDGIEMQAMWNLPITGFSVNASAAYADIRLGADFVQQTADGGETVTEEKGTPWPRAPKWQTTASIAWSGVWNALDIGVALNHSYFGEAIAGFGGFSSTRIFNYSTYGLQFTLDTASPKWPSVAMNISNLTDKRGVNFSQLTGGGAVNYNQPRAASIRLTYEF